MSKSTYTNADIMRAIGELTSKVDTVAAQAAKTNGRVTTIENWKNAIEAVETYKKENSTVVQKADTVVIQQKWFQNERLVGSVVAVLLALAGAIGYFAGGAR